MNTSPKRVVVTGMGVNTPLGDGLDTYLENLLAGVSAISRWQFFDDPRVLSKVGGDLSGYDVPAKVAALADRVPEVVHARLRKLAKKAPFSTRLTMLATLDAWLEAGLGFDLDPDRQSIVVAGHNLAERYLLANHDTFHEEPDWIDGMAALHNLDTDHAGSVGEVLGSRGALYTMGGACASGNVALRNAVDEVSYHDMDVVVVAGAPLDFSAMGLHAMGIMGAISIDSFNDEPHRASRPFDTGREGFVPTHGAATLILESLDHAQARGARIHAELLGCVATSDASHLPTPSEEGQVRTIERLLARTGLRPADVDYVNAHATSTPLGDLAEIGALRRVFGDHAGKLRINATKSMVGHTCWSAPLVETVAAILQMNAGCLHPSINVDEIDPDIDLDVCPGGAVEHEIEVFLKNSFGFGGINCCALYRKYTAA